MSQPADQTQTPADSAVRNTVGKRSKQAPDSNPGYLPADKLQKICEKHYNQILPIMAKKVHQEKLQGVQTRLDFGESLRQHSRTRGETIFSESESCDRQRKTRKKRRSSPASAPGDTYYSQNTSVFSRLRREETKPTHRRSPVSTTMFTKLGNRDRNVFQRLGERKKDIHSRLGPEVGSRLNVKEKSKENEMKQIGQTAGDQSVLRKPLSWKMRITKADTGNPNQRNKGRRMKKNCNPEDHLKNLQTAAKIERWAMPTWCHMFNSTLIGSARVWFDKLPPKSIDNYEILRKAFLGNFSQQKKYIKDPWKSTTSSKEKENQRKPSWSVSE
ncbi:hypothetical protein Tco_1333614 [Tanacetum coccineum]